MMESVSNIAQQVIEKCGGVQRVADICGISTVSVHKWKYPKSKGGRGGFVPLRNAESLLAAAYRGEVDLEPGDFFENKGRPTEAAE